MIELNQLTKRYGKVAAVDGLTATVQPGLVTGFLGPNGSGKSTTLKMILGLAEPTSGTATISGRRFREHRRGLRHVGALIDAGNVHGGRSARNHLLALAMSNALPRRRVDEVLHEVGLAEVAQRRVGRYSLGMRQRLGIAAALLGDPPVLLFDEPFNGLDPEGVRWLRSLFRQMAGEGRTVLVSSHLMSEMAQTADQFVVLGRGRLLAAESRREFTARCTPATVTVRSSDNIALAVRLTAVGASVQHGPAGTLTVEHLPATRISELARDHDILLHELTTETGSLEQAFMELTSDSVEYLAGGTR